MSNVKDALVSIQFLSPLSQITYDKHIQCSLDKECIITLNKGLFYLGKSVKN